MPNVMAAEIPHAWDTSRAGASPQPLNAIVSHHAEIAANIDPEGRVAFRRQLHPQPAVHNQHLSCYIRRSFTRKERHRLGNFVHFTEATHRDCQFR